MYDMAVPNHKPGRCEKCIGTGVYAWGANGKAKHSGACFSCRGSGRQDEAQIKRNCAYDHYKFASIMLAGLP
jgi:excinuclease UvrABC ATPase subunit